MPAPDFMWAVAKNMQSNAAEYHTERTVIRLADIFANTQSIAVSNVQMGHLPKCFIAFVASGG